ncbi:glycosyltransferase [Shimia sp. Alg240-R146]|uniref:glycosyltransferase n=1 Tax=Shimia sp. Alg240-R146 TaxID=2993449 RepID=UPI0022DFBCBA|nr:glycosyltransferase [Shimia sp. Alg240-R146]
MNIGAAKKTQASQNDFWSVDSQPEKLSGPVALWRAPAVLATFMVLCSLGLYALHHSSFLNYFFPTGDWVFVRVRDQHFVAIRQFLLSYFVAFGLFSNGSARARARLILAMVGYFLAFCLILDLSANAIYQVTGLLPALNVQQIAAGVVGFAIFSTQVFGRGAMPETVAMTVTPRRRLVVAARFVIITVLAAFISMKVNQSNPAIVSWLRHWALLGGLGPGVFLFLPSLFLMLFILSLWDRIWSEKDDRYCPPLSVVVPAHNEEYILAHTIASLDAAAERYGGDVTLLVVNNNSSDNTFAVAQKALEQAAHLTGRVLEEARAGKAHALNLGFSQVETEFVIRIDADTQIEADALWRAMSHFANPEVGCVGGVPRTRGRSFFERARQAEVLVNHGYYSIATDSLEALVAVPGMFAAYRTALTHELGGFSFGLNGEDSEMSMRIGEMGYHVMVDPRVHYESEVPATMHHMREQRMRWFRSSFHIAARCADASHLHRASIRGSIILPLMLFNAAVRGMTICLIFFGFVEYMDLFARDLRPQLHAIFSVAIGAPFLVSVMAICINRAWYALLYVPEYTLFRLLRSYFTLESMLSIKITERVRKEKRPVTLPALPQLGHK